MKLNGQGLGIMGRAYWDALVKQQLAVTCTLVPICWSLLHNTASAEIWTGHLADAQLHNPNRGFVTVSGNTDFECPHLSC